MGRDIAFETPLGSIGGWRADPVEAPRGALVVIQEIFGVNAHMRSVVDRYAAAGYMALAPAFFDPVERGVELGYDEADVAKARGLVDALGFDKAIAIVDAAAQLLHGEGLKVGAVGFCWGGTRRAAGEPAPGPAGGQLLRRAQRSASSMSRCARRCSSTSATRTAAFRPRTSPCIARSFPTPRSSSIRPATPSIAISIRKHYAADSARLAHRRTLEFFAQSLG